MSNGHSLVERGFGRVKVIWFTFPLLGRRSPPRPFNRSWPNLAEWEWTRCGRFWREMVNITHGLAEWQESDVSHRPSQARPYPSCTRKQLPLTHAYAITAHKIQRQGDRLHREAWVQSGTDLQGSSRVDHGAFLKTAVIGHYPAWKYKQNEAERLALGSSWSASPCAAHLDIFSSHYYTWNIRCLHTPKLLTCSQIPAQSVEKSNKCVIDKLSLLRLQACILLWDRH